MIWVSHSLHCSSSRDYNKCNNSNAGFDLHALIQAKVGVFHSCLSIAIQLRWLPLTLCTPPTHTHTHTHTGEPVSASECFTVNTFPSFLRHSHYPHTSTHPPASQPHTITHNTPIDPAPTSSTFTPVDPSLKHTYVTPDLFGQPTLGKAVASSTPSSLRTISFPHEPIPFRLGQDTQSVDRHVKDHTSSGVGMLTDPKMVVGGKRTFSGDRGLSVLRGALDFGSASVGSGRVVSKTAAVIPLTPRWVGRDYKPCSMYMSYYYNSFRCFNY